MRSASMRLAAALLLAGATASCAYYNTFYLARKYYFKATEGQPYEVDRDNSTQRTNYLKSGDYSKKLLGVYPRSKWVDDAWLLWAGTLIGTDDPLKAVAMLEEFRTRFPKSDLRPDATFFLGLAYRAARKHEKAMENLDEFLAEAPRNVLTPYAYYERSKALMSLQRYQEAAASAGQIMERWPNHVLYDRALRQRAEARFQQHAWQGAREDFHSIGARALTDEDRLRYLLREVDCLEASRDYDQARMLLRDARAHEEPPPPVPQAPRPVGSTSTPPPQYYTAATPAQERYGRLTLRMGGVEVLDGHVKEAVDYFESVLHDYPRSQLAAEAQFRIGFAYETGADDFARARTEYGKVREVAGTSQFSQQAQQRLDNLERIERFRTAVGSDSSERKAEAKFLVAEHYLFNLERPERAVDEYRAIAESSAAPAVKARALNAEAWVLSRKLSRQGAADSLFWAVVRKYPATEAQLAARDYLEAEGQSVPERLIVAPKEPMRQLLDTLVDLPRPPADTPKLGSPAPVEPGAVKFGPGVNVPPGGAMPIIPPSWRPSALGDSSRRAIVLRDSLMREARRDTSMAGRVRLDSLRRAFFHPDTTGRGAQMAELERQIPRPQGVVIAPDSTPPPRFSSDSTAVRTRSRLTRPKLGPPAPPGMAGPIVEVDAGGASGAGLMGPAFVDSARARSAAVDSARAHAARPSAQDSALAGRLAERAAADSARMHVAPGLYPGANPARTPPPPPRVEPKPLGSFSSVWIKTTKAQRDSIHHAKAQEDSLRRAAKAAAKALKHAKSSPDSTRGGGK